MIIYLIKTTFCALFFLLIYMILFERENMNRFKRHYLLCSLVLSFTIPLVSLNIPVPQLNEEINRLYSEINIIDSRMPEQNIFFTDISDEVTISTALSIDYSFIIKVLYVIVTLVMFFRLLKNFFNLLRCARIGKTLICHGEKIVLTREVLTPYSFGNYIYINEEDYKNGLIAEEMIKHEQAHIKQWHSLDLIFIELIITLFWFNPVLYFYRWKIKQNHEFLADEAVLKEDINVKRYQNILISIISKNGSTGLASSLNYSTIKKRFIMMKKETSKRTAWYRKVLLIPALLFAICMFSTHTIAVETSIILPDLSTDEIIVAPINEISSTRFLEASVNISEVDATEEAGISELSRNIPEKIIINPEDTLVYNSVEKMPEFPEGDAALLKWISDNIIYPKSAAEKGIQGRVACAFTVNADGSVSDVKVVRSLDPEIDAEAVRVLSLLPKFKPGEEKGKPVRVKYSVPVRFSL